MKGQLVVAVLVGIGAASVVLHAQEKYRVRLATVPIDATMVETVSGKGSATAVLSGSTLTISGTFEGLATPATIAQVRRGPAGIRGPAIFDLIVTKGTSGTINGVVKLTPSQVEDLRQGRLYVQIHSEKAPEGNLRGWILR
jgi:hypothetical protein